MNLPNRLTILRICLVPVFVILMAAGPSFRFWAFLVFVIAGLTDLLDGRIARARNLVTDFGKIMDPLADKILVLAAMVCLCERGEVPGWTIIIVLFREFLVSGMRIVAAAKGNVIAAGVSGKIKTTLQIISLIMLLLTGVPFLSVPFGSQAFRILAMAVYYASVAMAVYSGADYVIRNKSVFLSKGI